MSRTDGDEAGTSLPVSTRSAECVLCNCQRFKIIAERDRRGDALETVVCCQCGLVSHARLPSDDELVQYYEQEYRSDYNGEDTPSKRRVVREWNRGRQTFLQLQPFVTPGDRIFEIGAGIGCNLKHFELAGFDASGIEPGTGFGRYSRETLRARVTHGFWSDVAAQPAFDVVLLIHVLEHLNSPLQALRHIRRMLRPKGRLFVEVPNLAAPHAAPGRMFHYAHVYNYTPWTLAMLATAAGFNVGQVMTGERDRNLAMLLSRAADCRLELNPESYRNTVRAVTRYNAWNYHFRPNSLWERYVTIRHSLADRFFASQRLPPILKQCADGAALQSNRPPVEAGRRAA